MKSTLVRVSVLFVLLVCACAFTPSVPAEGRNRQRIAGVTLGALKDVWPSPRRGRRNFWSRSIHRNILSRRTINDFETTLPEGWEEALHRAVEAATYAPNHKRTEPWRFHLLGPAAIQRVCELNAEIVTAKKGEAAGDKKLQRWLAMPGWLVVTCVKSDESMDNPMSLAREDYAACCCAVQNLSLSLHTQGIGTKWTTGPVNFDSRFAEAAGLSSDEYVVGTMWFGTPGRTPEAPAKKLSIEDVLVKHD